MAIKIDVSEIKSFKGCKRQWQFTSRNRYHVVPRVPNKALALGTIFHEALAQLYLGADYEKVMALVKQEMSKDDAALIAMLKGYNDHVLHDDLVRWTILEVEHRFELPVEGLEDVILVGSIDLIVYDTVLNKVYGVEHKTCSTFREAAFLFLDEQPRVYQHALDSYIAQAKAQNRIPQSATNGGIYINEVKKLLRDFQYKRELCYYDSEDSQIFWTRFLLDLHSCKTSILVDNPGEVPTPSWFNCKPGMCAFTGVCSTYGYRPVPKEVLVEDFGTEFRERECDHLDEKLSFGTKIEGGN